MNAVGGKHNMTPLQWAHGQDHKSMVVLLMQHGADLNNMDTLWSIFYRIKSSPCFIFTGRVIYLCFSLWMIGDIISDIFNTNKYLYLARVSEISIWTM